MSDKITFGDLSVPLKIGITAAWIVGILYVLAFLFGFFAAMVSI